MEEPWLLIWGDKWGEERRPCYHNLPRVEHTPICVSGVGIAEERRLLVRSVGVGASSLSGPIKEL
jgi:hypothetical protein